MSNMDLLKQGYKDFATGNVEGVISVWRPDIVWNECKGFPFVENDGIYVGPKAIVEGVFAKIPQYYDDFKIEISDLVDGGDKIVMVGYYTGIWKATGRKFKANAMHSWKIKDGKVASFFQAVDSAEIMK
jgi:ketosteroid isomerase-like protein